ncbi:MAG: carboxypeptidase M32 [Rhodospirillaceae bacterium]|nr:carboxypeptidase M32 [Rhodospirillaceae bacterium]
MTPYQQLETVFRQAALIDEASSFLSWDASVNMPDGSAASRAEQLATLRVLSHEALTRPQIAEWLDAAEGSNVGLDPWQRANLREMRRNWVHRAAVPPDLVAARTRAESACEMVWREAKPKGDFAAVLPALAEVLRLTVEMGQAKATRLGTGLYDALLDQYEPQGRAADIDPIFVDLAAFLPGAIDRAMKRQAQDPAIAPQGPFPADRQRGLSVELMRRIGFPFEQGRLDVSRHPFSGGTPDDLRITTRYDEEDFARALMGTLHETGHAMYEAGLPKAWRRQPVGEARGMAMHESQSLLLEMQVCRSREFVAFAAPMMRAALGHESGDADEAWSADNLYRLGIRVTRGFIRVDADEITYPCHVILRYRLERAMIAGDLALADLPGAWAEGMKALLGVVPPNDALGCLQDIHWYIGAWGYFPTYTLGALAAAQLFEALERAIPDIRAAIGRGEFAPLFKWLREHVHGKASLAFTQDLLEQATGAKLGTAAFKAHLAKRYGV